MSRQKRQSKESKKPEQTPSLRITAGYNGSLLMQYGLLSGTFYPHVRTLTGLRFKKGNHRGRLRGLTASEVRGILKRAGVDIRLLRKPYGFIEFETDSWGFFNPFDTRDVLEATERAGFTYTITLPVGMLARLANRG